jgi:O-antigen ligase
VRWPLALALAVVLAGVTTLAWTRLPQLHEGFKALMTVESADGLERPDFWQGTVRSWARSPLLGSGLGSYRHVITLDKPATDASVLERAHNDWLEWAATSGVLGAAVLLLAVVGMAVLLRPAEVRRLRFEYRYPLAGAVLALTAAGLHELVGSGLQTPLNRLLLATWIGLAWGVRANLDERRSSRRRRREKVEDEAQEAEVAAEIPDIDRL